MASEGQLQRTDCRSVYATGLRDPGVAVEKLIEDSDWLKTARHASAEHVDGERGLFLKFSHRAAGAPVIRADW